MQRDATHQGCRHSVPRQKPDDLALCRRTEPVDARVAQSGDLGSGAPMGNKKQRPRCGRCSDQSIRSAYYSPRSKRRLKRSSIRSENLRPLRRPLRAEPVDGDDWEPEDPEVNPHRAMRPAANITRKPIRLRIGNPLTVTFATRPPISSPSPITKTEAACMRRRETLPPPPNRRPRTCDANFGSSAYRALSICSSIRCSCSESGTDPSFSTSPRRKFPASTTDDTRCWNVGPLFTHLGTNSIETRRPVRRYVHARPGRSRPRPGRGNCSPDDAVP